MRSFLAALDGESFAGMCDEAEALDRLARALESDAAASEADPSRPPEGER